MKTITVHIITLLLQISTATKASNHRHHAKNINQAVLLNISESDKYIIQCISEYIYLLLFLVLRFLSIIVIIYHHFCFLPPLSSSLFLFILSTLSRKICRFSSFYIFIFYPFLSCLYCHIVVTTTQFYIRYIV